MQETTTGWIGQECIQDHRGQGWGWYWQAREVKCLTKDLRLDALLWEGEILWELYIHTFPCRICFQIYHLLCFYKMFKWNANPEQLEWKSVNVGGQWLGIMPSVEKAGRVLQSSLAQGYSMSQIIPGQRLHAVMEHGWHVSGSNGGQSGVNRARCGQTDLYMTSHSLPTQATAHSHTLTVTWAMELQQHIAERWVEYTYTYGVSPVIETAQTHLIFPFISHPFLTFLLYLVFFLLPLLDRSAGWRKTGSWPGV